MLSLSARLRQQQQRHYLAMAAASSSQKQQQQKKKAAAASASAPPDPKRLRKPTTTSDAAAADADDAALPPSSHGGPLGPPAPLLAKAERIRAQLAALYPPPVPVPLDHASPFQLLVAVVLSAQSTDAKVNQATPALFSAAPTPRLMAELGARGGILPLVRSIGLAPTKSRNLALLSSLLLERHGGEVPASLAELVALPGVGRKTASVVLAQAFGGRAFPVDTHIHRCAQRWGLTPPGPSVEQTESDLRAVFPDRAHWRDLHLRIIFFGREHCPAKSHDPAGCPICSWAAVAPFDGGGGGGGDGGAAGAAAAGAKRSASVSPVKAGASGASALLLIRRAAAEAAAAEDDNNGGGGADDGDDGGQGGKGSRRRRAASARGGGGKEP